MQWSQSSLQSQESTRNRQMAFFFSTILLRAEQWSILSKRMDPSVAVGERIGKN